MLHMESLTYQHERIKRLGENDNVFRVRGRGELLGRDLEV